MIWCSCVVAVALLLLGPALCSAEGTSTKPSAASPISSRLSDPANQFLKLPRVCMPWAQPIAPRVGNCGFDVKIPCNVSELAAACLATPMCNAFNSNGYLKSCAGGRCDCDLAGGVSNGTILWGSPEARECFMPEVGNGFLGSTVSWGALYVAGLFNGACGSVRKARLPSPIAVSVNTSLPGVTILGGALDTLSGVYRRRYEALSATGLAVQIEQRFYAHRTRPSVLGVDFEVLTPLDSHDAVNLSLSSLWKADPNGIVPPDGHIPGSGCAGSFSQDFTFHNVTQWGPTDCVDGSSTIPGDNGEIWNITMIVDRPPAVIVLTSASPSLTLLSVVSTSLEAVTGGDSGSVAAVHALAWSVYNAAVAAGPAALMAEHLAAWATLSSSGVDVYPSSSDPADVSRSLDIATHANSALYYLRSAIREEWQVGVSPGGISSGSYQGAVFMDQDVWVSPALYLLNPTLAASTLGYRFISSQLTDAAIASTFGYKGDMVAWTAAFEGRPFGCCDGKGGYEDCLEQHVTGDTAWSAWQYYSATGDLKWLRTTGFPILSGAADFHLSRVSAKAGGGYSVNGVLPIDEWCVGSGCGCETPGVTDDAFTNAVVRLSLLNAAAAARLLNLTSPHTALWASVGEQVQPLFNGTNHFQFTSPTCPNGFGGSHYSPAHTVCPEDVMLLTYPLGDAMDTPLNVSAADAELFIPVTCQENAGMTTPIHAIVWLALGNPTLAQASLNRSMHAAAYGPFNVRNEVDVHLDIIGGKFNNSKFLTGDGGFLQAIVNGYGSLRIAGDALKLLGPQLPESVGKLVIRSFLWRQHTLTLTVEANSVTIALEDPAATALSVRAGGTSGACVSLSFNSPVTLDPSSDTWPAILTQDPCS